MTKPEKILVVAQEDMAYADDRSNTSFHIQRDKTTTGRKKKGE
jgi:hypothetical protein